MRNWIVMGALLTASVGDAQTVVIDAKAGTPRNSRQDDSIAIRRDRFA